MLDFVDTFLRRHLGSSSRDVEAMLAAIGAPSLDALIDQYVTLRLLSPE